MEWTRRGWIILWTKFLLFVAVLTEKNQRVQDVGLIACTAKLFKLDVELRTAEVEKLMVECPRSCLDDNYCYVIGSGPYTETSSVCCAAIHSGVLNNNEGGHVFVNINYVAVSQFFKSTKNNVTTRSQYRASPVTFELESVQTQTTTTTRPTTSSIPTTTTIKASHLHNIIDIAQPAENPRKFEESRSSTTRTEKTTKQSAKAPTSTHTADGYDVAVKTEETTKTISPTKKAVPNVVRDNTIIDPFVEKICLGIGAFVAGAACVSVLVCLRRKKKKMRQRRCGGKFSSGTRRSDEGDVCVCYQNLNSSKQGLLYDPETCDRPCPIRQTNQNEDLIVSKASLMSEKELNKSSKRAKLEIACEDTKCIEECSGACNPALYDF